MASEGLIELNVIASEIMFEQEDQLDTYVIVETAEQKEQTKTLAGKSKGNPPKWDESFDILVNDDVQTLTFTMFDEDVEQDNMFGSGQIQLSVLKVDNLLDQVIDLVKDGQCTAKLRISSKWTPYIPEDEIQD